MEIGDWERRWLFSICYRQFSPKTTKSARRNQKQRIVNGYVTCYNQLKKATLIWLDSSRDFWWSSGQKNAISLGERQKRKKKGIITNLLGGFVFYFSSKGIGRTRAMWTDDRQRPSTSSFASTRAHVGKVPPEAATKLQTTNWSKISFFLFFFFCFFPEQIKKRVQAIRKL